MNARNLIMLCLALVVGCGAPDPADYKSYTATLTRPDGAVHWTFRIRSTEEPRVTSLDDEGGCLRVLYWRGPFERCVTRPFPVGWMVEVEPDAEAVR